VLFYEIKKYIYSYLKCIVYDMLLKPRQSFRITLYFCIRDARSRKHQINHTDFCSSFQRNKISQNVSEIQYVGISLWYSIPLTNHPSMALQPLLGPGLHQMEPPFFSIPSSSPKTSYNLDLKCVPLFLVSCWSYVDCIQTSTVFVIHYGPCRALRVVVLCEGGNVLLCTLGEHMLVL